jgi:hypothetical protein
METALLAIRGPFEKYCSQLGVRPIFRTNPADDGAAHVEFDGHFYHYVSCVRGRENERRIASGEDEILYWLLSDIVFNVACDFELKHRVKGKSFRRLLFAKELELIRALNVQWEARKRNEINEILAMVPFDDAIEG